jgi:hypothetical protein
VGVLCDFDLVVTVRVGGFALPQHAAAISGAADMWLNCAATRPSMKAVRRGRYACMRLRVSMVAWLLPRAAGRGVVRGC